MACNKTSTSVRNQTEVYQVTVRPPQVSWERRVPSKVGRLTKVGFLRAKIPVGLAPWMLPLGYPSVRRPRGTLPRPLYT